MCGRCVCVEMTGVAGCLRLPFNRVDGVASRLATWRLHHAQDEFAWLEPQGLTNARGDGHSLHGRDVTMMC
jgi:hypothetical protein